MKTIKESVSLKGQLEEITMTELRARPGQVIDSVELGKTFTISKAGRVIAVIAPVPAGLSIVVQPNGTVTYAL